MNDKSEIHIRSGRSRRAARSFSAPLALALRCDARRLRTRATKRTATLNADKSNAVLVCHALNASHHVAGYYADDPGNVGWWDNMIGPGQAARHQPLLRRSASTTSAAASARPARRRSIPRRASHGAPISRSSPSRTGSTAQARLADRLGIERFAAVMGGSLGGMQALSWAIQLSGAHRPRARDRGGAEPVGAEHRVQRGRAARRSSPIPIFTAATSTRTASLPRARAARRAHDRPHHVPVRRCRWRASSAASCATAAQLLVRRRVPDRDRTCATRATSSPSTSTPTRTCASPRRSTISIRRRARRRSRACALAPATARFLVVVVHDRLALSAGALARDRQGAARQPAATSPTRRSTRRTATTRSCSTTRSITALVARVFRHRARSPTLDVRASDADVNAPHQRALAARADFATIASWIAPGARVLDLGCGDGCAARVPRRAARRDRLRRRDRRRRRARERAQRRQRAAERPRARACPDSTTRSFDCVILSQTLQAMRQHRSRSSREMLRVGREAIVTFPNFGHWRTACRFCAAACRCRSRCPTSGTTRRTSICARSPTSTRSCSDRGCVMLRTRSCSRRAAPVTLLPNLPGELARVPVRARP